jgi:hypothetical protein
MWTEAYDFSYPHYHPLKDYGPSERSDKSTFNSMRRDVGHHSLAVAVIEQAITDYFTLVRARLVRFGKLAGSWSLKAKTTSVYRVKHMTRSDAECLLEFLQSFNRYADAIELKRDWSDLWRQVKRLEATGNYRLFLQIHDNDDEFTDESQEEREEHEQIESHGAGGTDPDQDPFLHRHDGV